jgi:hypothetical protein
MLTSWLRQVKGAVNWKEWLKNRNWKKEKVEPRKNKRKSPPRKRKKRKKEVNNQKCQL